MRVREGSGAKWKEIIFFMRDREGFCTAVFSFQYALDKGPVSAVTSAVHNVI